MEKFKIKIDELPSIYKEPEITSTIKKNPYLSNVEVEGREKILSPDLSAVYTAVGKRHSKGGMDVYLPPDSFVFSDFKDMAITPKEHEQFQLKKGGSIKPIDNTPSKVVGRNIDTKHYNKMTSIVDDNKRNHIDKRTAMLMLNKYGTTLGRVAYLQESKKNFPDGVPEFAKDTAPVIDNQLKDEIMENKQYMKFGGKTKNPFLPKAQTGQYNPAKRIDNSGQTYTYDANGNLNPDDATAVTTPANGASPTLQSTLQFPNGTVDNNPNFGIKANKGMVPTYTPSFEQGLSGLGNNGYDITKPSSFNPQMPSSQHQIPGAGYGSKDFTSVDGMVDFSNRFPDFMKANPSFDPRKSSDTEMFQNWYTNNVDKNYFAPKGTDSPYAIDGKFGQHTWSAPTADKQPPPPPPPPITTPPSVTTPGPTPPNLNINPQKAVNPYYGWTNDMKRTTALAALNAASIQKGQTYRSQISTPLVQLERVNPQAALNNADNATYRASQSMRGLNPYLAAGQNASTFGQSLDAKNQIQSQYDNQNAGIANQQNEMNVQSQDQEAKMNTAYDQDFFKNNQINNAHFSNAKQVAWNNVNDNVNANNLQVNRVKYFNATLSPNSPYYLSLTNGNYNPIANPNRSIMGVRDPFGMNKYQEQQQMQYINMLRNNGITDQNAIIKGLVGLDRNRAFGQSLPQNSGYYPQQAPNPFQRKGGKIRGTNPYKTRK